ncbi:MAG: S-layer homology domain-containing protein [Oscillospiraceae bacterium]|nr:S-layer homology domain-containing protein [Oscillospiraceae bacterium]
MKKFLLLLVAVMLCFSLCAGAQAQEKAIWQDPDNVVLVWENEDGSEYKIYRSNSKDGDFEHIGNSDKGSYRDATATYPNTYYYKIEKSGGAGASAPFCAVVAPEELSAVSVIMYHNFVSEEDIKNGVEFEEYSISPADFEQDLIWLKNNGYVTITSDDLLRHLEGRKSIPEKAVIISIDDGSWGVYKNAWLLLRKYNMKADFNVIGAQIDATWDALAAGDTRDGEPAPYCTWEELVEMSESGEINICSHTYGLHVYNKDKRIGMSMMEGESAEAFAEAVGKDYALAVKCIEGWTGKAPETVAYPYSKRSGEGDAVVLANTGYKILMAGEGARGTAGNYFVRGCDIAEQLALMSRPCRMDGTPISTYLERIAAKDGKNGVNTQPDFTRTRNTDEIAKDYQLFDDVTKGDWFAGSVYYSYLNGLMRGVSSDKFAPGAAISRAMAATLLNRLAGEPLAEQSNKFADASGGEWWLGAAEWANETGVIPSSEGNRFSPDAPISREALAQAMYNCGKLMKLDMSRRAELEQFTDSRKISDKNRDAVSWAVANGIFKGNADGSFNPSGNVTRAEMTMVLRNWLCK